MSNSVSTLSENDRQRLDGIVKKMVSNNEPDENIQFVVEDFKQKYGVKKNSSPNGGEVGVGVSPTPSASQDAGSKPLFETVGSGGYGDWWIPKNKAATQPAAIDPNARIPNPFVDDSQDTKRFRTKKSLPKNDVTTTNTDTTSPLWQPQDQVDNVGFPSIVKPDPVTPLDQFNNITKTAADVQRSKNNKIIDGLISLEPYYKKDDIHKIMDDAGAAQQMDEYFSSLQKPARKNIAQGSHSQTLESDESYNSRPDVQAYNKEIQAYNQIKPLLKEFHSKKLVDDFLDGKIDKDTLYEKVSKQVDPIMYKQSKEAMTEKRGLDALSDQSNFFEIVKGLKEEFTGEDISKKETLNSVKGVGELTANAMLVDRIQERMHVAKEAGADEKVKELTQQLDNYNPDAIYKYPVLVEKKLTAELTHHLAGVAGQLEGSETQDYTLKLFNDRSSKFDYASDYLKKQGYADNPKTAAIATKILADIMIGQDKIGDASYLGGAQQSFVQPFADTFKSIGDITGYRKDSDVIQEKITDAFFPNEVDGTKKNVGIVRNIVNTTSNVLSQATLQYLTAGGGRALGLTKEAAQSAAFWTSGSLPAYDQAYKESMDFIENPAGRQLFATAVAAFTGYTERMFKDIKLLDVPAAREAITTLAKKAGTDAFTKELTDELLTKAKTGFVEYARKYVKNIGEESLEEVAGQIFTDINKIIWGDPNTDMSKLMSNAKDTFIQTAVGTSLIGGWGSYVDARNEKNSTYKSAIYDAALYHDESEDALAKGLHQGVYTKEEYNSKMQILNTARNEISNLDKVEKTRGSQFDIQQRQVYVANRVAELSLSEQLANTKDEVSKKEIESRIKNLQDQRQRIFSDDVKFDETLTEINTKETLAGLNEKWKQNIRAIGERTDINDDEKEKLKEEEDKRYADETSKAVQKDHSIGEINKPAPAPPVTTHKVGDYVNGYTIDSINPDGTYNVTDNSGFSKTNVDEASLVPTPVVEQPAQQFQPAPVSAPIASDFVRQPNAPPAEKKQIEQPAPPSTIDQALDTRVMYKGEEGDLYQEGQTVVVETPTKKYELGNVDQIKTDGLDSHNITIPEQKVAVNTDGTLSVNGENFMPETLEIKRDDQGNIQRVTINNEKGRRRKFSGQLAEDIAYQSRLKEITQNNDTQQRFSEYIAAEPAIAAELNGQISTTTAETPVGDNGTIQGATAATGTERSGETTATSAQSTIVEATQPETVESKPITTQKEALDALTPDERKEYDRLIDENDIDGALELLENKINNIPIEQGFSGVSSSDNNGITALEQKYKDDKKKLEIISHVRSMVNTLQSVLPGFEIFIHDDPSSYNSTVKKLNGNNDTAGNFAYKVNEDGSYSGRVDINLSVATDVTVAHEVTHGVLLSGFGRNKQTFEDFKNRISALVQPTTKNWLSNFVDQYDESVRPEEYLAELSGILASGNYGLKHNQTLLHKIAGIINQLVSKLTNGKFKPFDDIVKTKEAVDFFNSMVKAIGSGQALSLNKNSNSKFITSDFLSKSQVAVDNSNAVFETRDGKPIGYNYDTEKLARERFKIPDLKKISAGSDRTVFDIGNGRVLKVAHSARGLEQNVHEGSYDLVNEGILPKVFERGLNYVVAEKVDSPKGSKVVSELLNDLKYFTSRDFKYGNAELEDILDKWDMGWIRNYDILWYDFSSRRVNWGVKDGKPIHLDGGTFGGVQMVDQYRGKKNMDDAEFRKIYSESKALKKQYGDTDVFSMFQKAGKKQSTESAKEKLDRMLAEGLVTQSQYNKSIASIPASETDQPTQQEEQQLDDAIKTVNINGEDRNKLSLRDRIAAISNPATGETSDYSANQTLANAGYSAKGRPAQGRRTTIAAMIQTKIDFIDELMNETDGNGVHELMDYFGYNENRKKAARDIPIKGISTPQDFQMVNALLSYIHNTPISESNLSPQEAVSFERYLQKMTKRLGREIGQSLNTAKAGKVNNYMLSDMVIDSYLPKNQGEAMVEAEDAVMEILSGEADEMTDEELLAAEEESELVQKESGLISRFVKTIKQKTVSEAKSKRIAEKLEKTKEKVKEFINKIKCD